MSTPGVPSLLNNVTNILNSAALIAADFGLISGFFAQPQWGIYLNGQPFVIADSCVSVDYKREYRVSDYPQEQGAFESYNKVQTPYDAKVQLSKGGTQSDINTFLTTIEAAAASLDLFDVVMPEKTYSNANIVHIDFERKASRGAHLIIVDIWLIEVRVSVNAAFTNTQSPSGSSPSFTGNVQPGTPPILISGVM